MKTKSLASLLTVMLLLVGASGGYSATKGKVLLLPREGSADTDFMLEKEIGVMVQMLTLAGYGYDVATSSGKTIKGSQHELRVDLRISEVNLANYLGLLMPCMAAGGVPSWHSSPDQIALVKAADALKLTVAAQASSVIILAEAGILLGKKYAYYWDPTGLNKGFDGSIYSGTGVVQDRNIITSGNCPYVTIEYGKSHVDGTKELTENFLIAISLQ